jgi:hypothetical protein
MSPAVVGDDQAWLIDTSTAGGTCYVVPSHDTHGMSFPRQAVHGYPPWTLPEPLVLGIMGFNKRAENLYGLPACLNGLEHASNFCPQTIPALRHPSHANPHPFRR